MTATLRNSRRVHGQRTSTVQTCASEKRTAIRSTRSRCAPIPKRGLIAGALALGLIWGCSSEEAPASPPATTSSGGDAGSSNEGGAPSNTGGDNAHGGTATGNSGGTAPDPGGAAGSGGASGFAPIPGVERGDELCGSAPGGDIYGKHVLRFENADAAITVQIGRTYLGPGVGESSIYGLTDFSLLIDGVEHCSGDPGDITETGYQNTHHNWQDLATATLETVHYELFVGMDFSEDETLRWAPTLSAVDRDSGETLLDGLPLTATGGPASCWTCPSSVPVLITEVLAHNESTVVDEQGEYEPWIELFNPSSSSVNLAGWTLSNDLADRTRWRLPDVMIPRHGYLLVFADAQPAQGELHANFRLSPEGGAIILTTADGVTNGGQAFGPQAPDQSFGFTF
ncbi:MAG TPA: lamin tail domain-containing protein, partial [Polyangiaceae bacterium]|nr:lamin tail domain-containing protein [Polyangiaceae bacterium]